MDINTETRVMVLHEIVTADGVSHGRQLHMIGADSPVAIILRSTRTLTSTRDNGTSEIWVRCES